MDAPREQRAIELLLDAEAEHRIRAEWEALRALGVSSLAAHTSPTNRPHVTALSRPRLADFGADAVARLEARLPIAVELGAPVLLAEAGAERGVLVRPLAPATALLAFHAELHGLAGRDAADSAADAPFTAPDAWTPHVTLARRLRLADLPRARAVLGTEAFPASLSALRRWDAAAGAVSSLS